MAHELPNHDPDAPSQSPVTTILLPGLRRTPIVKTAAAVRPEKPAAAAAAPVAEEPDTAATTQQDKATPKRSVTRPARGE